MTVLAEFRAGGRPRTKGSLTPMCRRDRKHTTYLTETVEESKAWRGVVARASREWQLERLGKFLRWPGAVEVRLVFFFPRTEGVTGSTLWPTHITLGDADKLARNVLDALSMPKKHEHAAVCSALIEDDSQVVKLSVAKFWSPADHEPGVQVLVMTVEDPDVEFEAVAASLRVDKWVRA